VCRRAPSRDATSRSEIRDSTLCSHASAGSFGAITSADSASACVIRFASAQLSTSTRVAKRGAGAPAIPTRLGCSGVPSSEHAHSTAIACLHPTPIGHVQLDSTRPRRTVTDTL
jgi:hypothetical protein